MKVQKNIVVSFVMITCVFSIMAANILLKYRYIERRQVEFRTSSGEFLQYGLFHGLQRKRLIEPELSRVRTGNAGAQGGCASDSPVYAWMGSLMAKVRDLAVPPVYAHARIACAVLPCAGSYWVPTSWSCAGYPCDGYEFNDVTQDYQYGSRDQGWRLTGENGCSGHEYCACDYEVCDSSGA